MLLALGLFTLGFYLLVKGADWLVEGSSSLARRFKISDFVIGLTVVSFGTSMPELIVNITASLQGSAEIAVGNVIGSNISNILLILGVSALIYPLPIQRNTILSEIPFSFKKGKSGVIIITEILRAATEAFDMSCFKD